VLIRNINYHKKNGAYESLRGSKSISNWADRNTPNGVTMYNYNENITITIHERSTAPQFHEDYNRGLSRKTMIHMIKINGPIAGTHVWLIGCRGWLFYECTCIAMKSQPIYDTVLPFNTSKKAW
jgi:hypothetical protein